MQFEIIKLGVVESTNALARSCAAGTVIVADAQTAGRGRGDHTWFSPEGANLYFSIVVPAAVTPEKLITLPLIAGFAIARAIGCGAIVKWINDVLIGGKKIAGVLCEALPPDRAIVGIGLNVNQREFPAELDGRATSLALEVGGDLNRDEVLEKILKEFGESYELWYSRS